MNKKASGFLRGLRGVLKIVWRYTRRSLFLLPALAAFAAYKWLPEHPGVAETVFARGVFRVVSVPLGFIMSWIPFSVTELLVVLAVPAALAGLTLFIIRLVRQKGRRAAVLANAGCAAGWTASVALLVSGVLLGFDWLPPAAWLTLPIAAVVYAAAHILYFYIVNTRTGDGRRRGGQAAGWVLSSLFFLYMTMHGLNAYRYPAAQLLGLGEASKDPLALQAVCMDLARKASAERENVHVDDEGCMRLEKSPDACLRQAGKGYDVLDDAYPLLWGAVGRAKPVRLSHWWSYTGITGMYFINGEANVNIDQPHSAIPATAAHELAHTRGFAREDECNFFAALSCFEHPSADYRYSGYLLAFIYCQNELLGVDEDLWREARDLCSEGVEADLSERREYWKQFEGPVQTASSQTNDSFIQSQGVEDGVRSYNRVVELMVAWYEQQGLI